MTKKSAQKWPVTGPMTLGILTTAVLVGGLGVWGVMTNIAGAIVASGQIEVDLNRQVVQHPDGGIVAKIHVIEGQAVAVGDPLIQLDGALLESELTIVEGQLFEILARRARLEAERDGLDTVTFSKELVDTAAVRPEVNELMIGQRRLFEARAETLDKQLEQLSKRQAQTASLIEGIDAQNVALTRQQDLIASELSSQQELLDKGLAQISRVLALQREEARLSGTVGELLANRAQSEGRITETEIEALRLSAARREEANTQLRDIGYRELELAERRRALVERIARLDIRAPVSGIVLGLVVTTPRSVIRAADPVLYLIPQDRPLVIAAQVPTVHIDQVHLGQDAKLVFSAFSQRTTPELHGTVSVVSADVFTDERTRAPYYRAEITLNPGEVEKLEGLTLIPGMPVEAFIRTEDRSPIGFLIKPFTDYFNRAFRES
ncbi:MAG: HlyD family type I secretion periplasmic adaptor subunit [Gemmobacter sp.]|nr:HlyD family type I secretion periplasmic adaptor subunit [Gemmobacter sp.]